MPTVLKMKLINASFFILIDVRPANIVTPISSGKGDAIIMPINAYRR